MKLGFTVEYDGTTYSGFQSQKNVLTVQGCIENALKKVTKEDIRINYSGRTDAGVPVSYTHLTLPTTPYV